VSAAARGNHARAGALLFATPGWLIGMFS
jgi:hypothetical protein